MTEVALDYLLVPKKRELEMKRFMSKLASVPRANRPASYGPIQFNFENKQPILHAPLLPPPPLTVNLFVNSDNQL
ncbi:hypothetical protein PV327_003791, partial [Microctonus hyperodae]